MAVIRPEKVAKIAELKELLTSSKCTVLVDFCGLTVAQDTELRRKMREAGVLQLYLRFGAPAVYGPIIF